MKIRIEGNSIRYRLREPEVENFKTSRSVTETIQFSDESEDLRFVLQQSSGSSVTILRSGNTTAITVPEAMARQWTETDLVGFDASVDIGNGKVLKVLVEKDFRCLDSAEEDDVGAYPNPAAQC